ncbi:MAG: histidine phosphatase family protein [Acidobacteriia bacterium]|nr:histidine phosphatase family protein [Terriglobia bacterium]
MARKTQSDNDEPPQSEFELYLMRHGIAGKPVGATFGQDFRRPLTAEGAEKVRKIGEGLKRLGVKPDWIVTSPLVRSLQTADLLATILSPVFPVSTSDSLRPGCSAEGFIPLLADHPKRKKVLAVGHEPDLSQLAARLIGSDAAGRFSLKKGGCCLISLSKVPPTSFGQLVCWVTPRILRGVS